MVVIEHYDLTKLSNGKLSNGEADDTWTFETPVPWSHSDLPDLELVSETEFTEVGGDRHYRWKLRHKDMGRRVSTAPFAAIEKWLSASFGNLEPEARDCQCFRLQPGQERQSW